MSTHLAISLGNQGLLQLSMSCPDLHQCDIFGIDGHVPFMQTLQQLRFDFFVIWDFSPLMMLRYYCFCV